MKRIIVGLVGALLALPSGPAAAWMHGGGSWSGSRGDWTRTGERGSTVSGGGGSWSADGFRGEEAVDRGVTEERALDTVLDWLSGPRLMELALEAVELYIWDRAGSDN